MPMRIERRPAASGSSLALLALLAAIAFASLAGCYSTRAVRPSTLASLDGYRSYEPSSSERSVLSLDGQPVTFKRGSELSLDLPGGRVAGTFESISVRDGTLAGQMSSGRTVVAPVATIGAAKVRKFQPAETAVVVVLSTLLTVVGASVLIAATMAQPVDGRALRIRGRAVLARTAADAQDWSGNAAPAPRLAQLAPDARAALAACWTEKARAEHASVPAFARLSLTLVAFGAPARLVEAVHRAGLQEIEHARLSFALASAYTGGAVGPGALGELAGAPAVTATSLEALAAESLVDGFFLEGVAADAAEAALSAARDPAVRAALEVIVPDERGHAELAWQIVAWCCEAGGPGVRDYVVRLSQRLPTVATAHDHAVHLYAALSEHGWLSPAAWRELERHRRRDVATRVAALGPTPRALRLV